MEIKVGDYYLTETRKLFRVIWVSPDKVYYDLKNYHPIDGGHNIIYGVEKEMLETQGSIISEEKMTKSAKILYG